LIFPLNYNNNYYYNNYNNYYYNNYHYYYYNNRLLAATTEAMSFVAIRSLVVTARHTGICP
jgi:hypothetical protein